MNEETIQSHLNLAEAIIRPQNGVIKNMAVAFGEFFSERGEEMPLLDQWICLEAQLRVNERISDADKMAAAIVRMKEIMEPTFNVKLYSNDVSDERHQFITDILRLIAADIIPLMMSDERNPYYQIHRIFSANKHMLSYSLLKVLPAATQSFVEVTRRQENSETVQLNAGAVYYLGSAFQQFEQGDRATNIELAIASFQQSIKTITQAASPVLWARILSDLATAWKDRILGDKRENVNRAITVYKQCMGVMTREKMPEDWAITMMNLATAYQECVDEDYPDNLERSIEACKQALQEVSPEANEEIWTSIMHNLATSYKDRIYGNEADNIEQAIEIYKDCLEIRTQYSNPDKWAATMNNLALAYNRRIKGDRAENIEDAISTCNQIAVLVTKEKKPFLWMRVMCNLTTFYMERLHDDPAKNIERAIQFAKQSLEILTQENSPYIWAMTMMNLGNAYSSRKEGDPAKNIEMAIAVQEKALEVYTEEDYPINWSRLCGNLAIKYIKRIEDTKENNIKQALSYLRGILKIITKERMPVDWARTWLNIALALEQQADADNVVRREQIAIAYEKSLEVFQPDKFPNQCRISCRALSHLYIQMEKWSDVVRVSQQALKADDILYRSSLLRKSQELELSESNFLFSQAAYAYSRTSDLEQAVLTLERSRARSLSDRLGRDKADLGELKQQAPHLYDEYKQLAKVLREIEKEERNLSSQQLLQSAENRSSASRSVEQSNLVKQVKATRLKFESTVQKIRRQPGYERFLSSASFADIELATTAEQPIVYLLASPYGEVAFVVYKTKSPVGSSQTKIAAIRLNASNEQTNKTKMLVRTWFEAYGLRHKAATQWRATIDRVTRYLWDLAMAPIVDYLSQNRINKAVLIPTSYLSFLPLHAAWTEDDSRPTGRLYALDVVTFSYAPNARALNVATAIAHQLNASSLLSVSEPTPTAQAPLPGAQREVAAAVAHFPNAQQLKGSQANRDTAIAELANHTLFHFSCHGFVNLQQPLQSGLLLANDETLSLTDFFNLQLRNVRLAILSACDSGLSGIELPDEAISLPTGLLQAGVAGIVASLWSVSDLSTMILLSRFYGFWRDHHLPPNVALTRAQQWLRDAEPKEIIAHCETFIPELADKTNLEAKQLRQLLRLDFSHPYYWAAFSYTGA